jgi:hypothetical protein
MGTYYRYVNYTRREFVSLSDLRDGGDKENAVLYCGPALAWLLVWPHTCGDGYRGRWRSRAESAPAHDVRIVSDGSFDFTDMADEGFLNITPGLLQSMRTLCPGFVEDYQPRAHDVGLLTHIVKNGSYSLLDAVSASCKCGWKVGPIQGDHRLETLAQIISDHLGSRETRDLPRPPRPPVYHAELSADDVCDLIDALGEMTSDKGREYRSDSASRLDALRDRLANLPGTR